MVLGDLFFSRFWDSYTILSKLMFHLFWSNPWEIKSVLNIKKAAELNGLEILQESFSHSNLSFVSWNLLRDFSKELG